MLCQFSYNASPSSFEFSFVGRNSRRAHGRLAVAGLPTRHKFTTRTQTCLDEVGQVEHLGQELVAEEADRVHPHHHGPNHVDLALVHLLWRVTRW